MKEKINSYLHTQFAHYKELLSDKDFIWSSLLGIVFLEFAYWYSSQVAIIATQNSGNPVGDIVHSHIARIDTSFIHGEISFFLFDIRYVIMFIFLRYMPFATKALALIIIVRDFFINTTHVGIPYDAIPIASDMTYGGDLFFSGHTANTFMLALIFWNIKVLRYFFIGMTIVFGCSAVLGRYHYSIDVLSAPFIAYGIYEIAKKFFSDDYARIHV